MKMDKTVFSAYKKEEEPNDFKYWQSKTVAERLNAAAYLNSIAYGYDVNHPPKVDRTVFSLGKHEDFNDINDLENLKE